MQLEVEGWKTKAGELQEQVNSYNCVEFQLVFWVGRRGARGWMGPGCGHGTRNPEWVGPGWL